jgi:hypothetical protein
MDARREIALIRKNYKQYQRGTGEAITWFQFEPFSPTGSEYDDVYDEAPYGAGGKKYKPGISVPVLMITETEDTKRAIPEGRQPVQVVNAVMSIEDMRNAGVDEPYEYQRHLNDMFFYDARYYSVSMFRVRGRAGRDDLLIVVEGVEVYVDQEMVNDPGPQSMAVQDYPWPETLPTLT